MGTQNFKIHSKKAHKGYSKLKKTHSFDIIFDLGVCKGETTLIWVYAEGYSIVLEHTRVPKG
jgi:hypothetical protein